MDGDSRTAQSVSRRSGSSALQFTRQSTAKCLCFAVRAKTINYESAAKITRNFTRKIAHLVPLSICQWVEKVLHRLGPHKCIPLHMFQKLVESVHLTHHVASCPQDSRNNLCHHSYLSAIIGSTRTALRAGRIVATSATQPSNKDTPKKETASSVFNPKSGAARRRETPAEATIPINIPARMGRNPSRMISLGTWAPRAPSAMRMPISCVRCATV